MSRDHYDGQGTIEKYRRDYERDEVKEEAMKSKMQKALAAAIKRDKQQISREALEAKKSGAAEKAFEEIRNELERGTRMNETYWGDEVTGFEDRPWERDEDE